MQCLAPAIGNFSMLNSIWLCLSDSRDFTSQLMLGTRDKRILQIFLVEGLTKPQLDPSLIRFLKTILQELDIAP